MSKITEDCDLGSAIHSAFRTASKSEEAQAVWELISSMPDEEWNDILESVYHNLPLTIQRAMEYESKALTNDKDDE